MERGHPEYPGYGQRQCGLKTGEKCMALLLIKLNDEWETHKMEENWGFLDQSHREDVGSSP